MLRLALHFVIRGKENIMNINKDWFANWFGTRYYRLLYKNRNEEEASRFLDLFLQHIPVPEGATILDLACGAGRHARYLASLGYHVTGIDINEESLQVARQFESEYLRFERHDIREAYASSAFDLVMNLFTSFGYFDSEAEDVKVLKNVSTALKKDGSFVIDYLNTDYIVSRLVDYEEYENEGVRFKIKRFLKSDFIVKLIEVYENENTYYFAEKIRMYNLQSFEEMIDEAGMQIVNIFGDYFFNEFDDTESPRLILHCKLK